MGETNLSLMGTALRKPAAFAPLSANLFGDCKAHFKGSLLREVLLAASGVKVSRIVANQEQLAVLHNLANLYQFSVINGRVPRLASRDVGKGLCSNQGRIAGPEEPGSFLFTYVARTLALAKSAAECDEVGDSEGFGKLLGIPACCRVAYRKFEPIARRSQGDLIPQVWKETSFDVPFDCWLNVAARYFGKSLISFFPCSFHCSDARSEAMMAYQLIRECSPALAATLLESHLTNVVYTEYQGVHVIRAPLIENAVLYKQQDVKSTSGTRVAQMIRSGDRLVIESRQKIVCYMGARKVGTVQGRQVFPCLFLHSDSEGLISEAE
jgi:hypothetical protein